MSAPNLPEAERTGNIMGPGGGGGRVASRGRSLLLELRFRRLLSVSLATFQAELEHSIPVFFQNYLVLCFGS